MANRGFRPMAVPTVSAVLILVVLTGCISPTGAGPDAKRRNAREMRADALEAFYRARPELRSGVPSSAGYAVFSNIDIQVLLLGGANGYGIAHDNRSGFDTYMHMAGGSIGAGIGAKDSRFLFVFRDPAAFDIFVEEGWEFGGDADAALIAGGDRGAQANATGSVTSSGAAFGGTTTAGWSDEQGSYAGGMGRRVDVYQLTRNGVALSASVSGSRYWKDASLN